MHGMHCPAVCPRQTACSSALLLIRLEAQDSQSVPWYLPVDGPLRGVHGGVAAGGDEVVGRVLGELRRQSLPVQARVPVVCLLEHLEDLFHHDVAPLFRQMQAIAAKLNMHASSDPSY